MKDLYFVTESCSCADVTKGSSISLCFGNILYTLHYFFYFIMGHSVKQKLLQMNPQKTEIFMSILFLLTVLDV